MVVFLCKDNVISHIHIVKVAMGVSVKILTHYIATKGAITSLIYAV